MTLFKAGINLRPYIIHCLQELSKDFEIIVFTASHQCYASLVLDYIDPKNKLIHHRLYRDNCIVTPEGVHIKDLRIFLNRNIQDIVIVDNACYSFGYQLDNGVPIIPFYDNKDDDELRSIIPYLKYLANHDIRETNRKTFKFYKYDYYSTEDDIGRELFF